MRVESQTTTQRRNAVDYEVIFVNPDQLVNSPRQPPSRMDFNGAMKHLQNSIKNEKLQYPPLVMAMPDGKYQIVDGHRRIHAMLQLGFPKIPVLPTFGHPDKLFAAVSGNVAKMSAAQWVTVYLRGGDNAEDALPSGPAKSCIKSLDKHMGRDYLERLEKRGLSPILWNLSNRIVKFANLQEIDRPSVLEWLILETVNTRIVSAWISANNSAEELKKAIHEKRSPRY